MNFNIWMIIRKIINALLPLREAETLAAVEALDLVALRAALRMQLESLRSAVTEQYSARDAHFVLFPLVAHCDELVKTLVLDLDRQKWPLLQQELYGIDNAGDVFFELLDSLLSKPETLPLVYEAYYFCLNDGFRGRHDGNQEALADYRAKLKIGIEQAHGFSVVLPAVPATMPYHPRFRIPRYAYYGAAVAVLIVCYLLLKSLADTWRPL